MERLRKKINLRGFTLIEALLAISIIIFIFLSASALQVSSEIFLKHIRTNFEKQLELNNALDHIVRNIRRSRSFGVFPFVSSDGRLLRLNINNIGIVTYSQSGDNIICNLESNPIAKDARVTFRRIGSLIKIEIVEDTSDPGEENKVPIIVISSSYARDK